MYWQLHGVNDLQVGLIKVNVTDTMIFHSLMFIYSDYVLHFGMISARLDAMIKTNRTELNCMLNN